MIKQHHRILPLPRDGYRGTVNRPKSPKTHRDNPNSGFSTGREVLQFPQRHISPEASQSSGCAPSATVTSRLDIGIESDPPPPRLGWTMNEERHRSKLASSEFGPGFRCLEVSKTVPKIGDSSAWLVSQAPARQSDMGRWG
jgi:hypothetical protein